MCSSVHRPGGGRYSQYSDDRDDRRIFLGVEIGDLVFFRGCSSKILERDKTGICLGIKTNILNTLL